MNNENRSLQFYEYVRDYLSFTMKDEEAERVAGKIVKHYENLGVMASASHSELMRINEINSQTALFLKLLGYLHSRSITDEFKFGKKHSDDEIKEYFKALFIGLSVETVYCLTVDARGRITSSECLGEGTINLSEIYPRRILECAAVHDAVGVIIAHNHPKGTSTPSNEDIAATEYIKCVLRDAGIELVDHYLVSDCACEKLCLK